MIKLPRLLIAVLLLLSLVVYLNRDRVAIAASLLATFVAFPLSNPTYTSTSILSALDRSNNHDFIKTQPVPAIIHQVRLGNLPMRPAWTEARNSCRQLHPDWQFRLWEDKESNSFVELHYPELNATYRSYPLEIQRSNILRYLLLDQLGGMYLDLDLVCHRPLDFLRNQPFLTPPANPTGINNAFIVSTPHHLFWSHVVAHIPKYNRDWYYPYVTNMFSTGCHFLSTMHRTYADQASLSILDAANKLNGHVTTPLFEHLGASSWHKKDAGFVLAIGILVERIKNHTGVLLGLSCAFILLTSVLLIAYARHRQDSARKSVEQDMEQHRKLLFD